MKSCSKCTAQFEITVQDREFLTDISPVTIPEPTLCPTCRAQRRMAWRGERKLYKRECGKCKKEMESTYAPGRPEKVYCEQCYLKELY